MKLRILLMVVVTACGRAEVPPTEQVFTKGGPPARPEILPQQATVRVGDTLRFVVIPTAEFPATEGWRWASINPAVVVDSMTGLARGVAPGYSTVTTTAVGHSDWKAGAAITVVP
jgi:hypothetical protein